VITYKEGPSNFFPYTTSVDLSATHIINQAHIERGEAPRFPASVVRPDFRRVARYRLTEHLSDSVVARALPEASTEVVPWWPSSPQLGFYSALGRIRTCDTRFRKPVLYPLSYEGRIVRDAGE
jgi:hypothetical protein